MPRWLILLLSIMFLVGCSGKAQDTVEPNTAPTEESTSNSTTINADEELFYAPDFTLTSIDGESITLNELQGQWILLNFWATWCKPCVAEMPALQSISDSYAERNLMVIGVDVREDNDLVQDFLAENDITYLILMTPRGEAEDKVLTDYFTSALPQTLIIAPNGEVRWRAFAELELNEFTTILDDVMTEWANEQS